MSRPWMWLSGFFFGVLISSFALTSQAGNFPGEQPVYSRDQGRQSLLFYVSGGNGDGKVEYICTADSGVASSAARWQISRLTYDSSDRVSTIAWAGGNDAFDQICDNRASLTYS